MVTIDADQRIAIVNAEPRFADMLELAVETLNETETFMIRTTPSGVPDGTTMPCQAVICMPATPCSSKVGTSGRTGRRCDPVRPSALSRPPATCCLTTAAIPGFEGKLMTDRILVPNTPSFSARVSSADDVAAVPHP